MRWVRTSTVDHLPRDPVADAMAEALADVLATGTVELRYRPAGTPPEVALGPELASASGKGPDGWDLTVTVRLGDRRRHLLPSGSEPLAEVLAALPQVGIEVAETFRSLRREEQHHALPAPLRRAMRDSIAAGILTRYLDARTDGPVAEGLISETIEYLVELSSSRVESHDLTHGVVLTDVLEASPRIELRYPAHLRAAKRAPLLFDGQHSVLVVDERGRARTELQRHRFDRLHAEHERMRGRTAEMVESGSLVAHATATVGGIGFYLRTDRSIWTFVDGEPLLVRRGERWRAFPFELAASITRMIGDSPAAHEVVQAAFLISAQPRGAILAIVEDASELDGIVPTKDRYDLRDEIDPMAMRVETRLHHLIDSEELDERTIARLAVLDGATILDRDGRLIAYGAIVTSSESQYEGARTAAARTLSEHALVVLKVSVDGDITVFRDGKVVATLLAGVGGGPQG
ncbi:diadenylate cyclase [Actinomarinicola tropica]|uniref:DAC domain-containing protein n=1 Tax=Actinomarinicola tropica TaxID=2789776 RepID=A0A5Q2RC56_9ACTN|nr:diadenylate cyclase [Actinomarinicola tropica]QGG94469.1 hypothetical protein GH723_04760 [Actinomarinicola tropica]